jgi:hypothetical protein
MVPMSNPTEECTVFLMPLAMHLDQKYLSIVFADSKSLPCQAGKAFNMEMRWKRVRLVERFRRTFGCFRNRKLLCPANFSKPSDRIGPRVQLPAIYRGHVMAPIYGCGLLAGWGEQKKKLSSGKVQTLYVRIEQIVECARASTIPVTRPGSRML